MEMALTSNGIAMICSGGEYGGGDDVKPVLQVAEIRLLGVGGQQNNAERYRVLLSDGVYSQQGMLATQLNVLVHSGKLQKGSIIQLSQFVSQIVQNRKIIIIVELNVLHEKWDPIGDPKAYGQGGGGLANGLTSHVRTSIPGQSSVDHPGTPSGNLQSYGGATASAPLQGGSFSASDASGRAALYNSKPSASPNAQPHGNPDSKGFATSNGPPLYLKTEHDARHPATMSSPRIYSDQNQKSIDNKPGVTVPLHEYGHPLQSPYQQPPPMYANRGPIAKNEAATRIVPIAALNPYQGKWTIKARVTSKKELRRYQNARGEGKVFSFDLLDRYGGEIQVTCFNAVADQFYDMLVVGNIYLISKGMLKPASKNFNRLNNEYEILLENSSVVQPCFDDDSSIDKYKFKFRSIKDIENMENNSIIDVIGVVLSISVPASIMKKDGTETFKRSLQLKDKSGRSVELTLWGNFCNAEGQQLQKMCDEGKFPIIAVKGGRINDFNGKSVGTISTSQLYIEPVVEERNDVRKWFDTEGRNQPCVSLSRETVGIGRVDVRKTVSQIKDERLGTSEKPDWITVNATIPFIKVDNFCYTACPLTIGDRKCSKKVTNNGDGQWRCDRCDKSVPECEYRYILQFQIQDHTGLTWATAFQEGGEEIMGIKAKDLYYLKNEDDEKFEDIIRGALFTQYIFKLKVKEETFSDEQRVKSTVVKAEKLDIESESRFLLDMIVKLVEDDNGYSGKAANGVMEVGGNNSGMGGRQDTSYGGTGGNINSVSRDKGITVGDNVGQYGNLYSGGGREQATVDNGVYVFCNSCGGTGHNAKNCPSIISNNNNRQVVGGYMNNRSSSTPAGAVGGSSSNCFKCNRTGHWAKDCPGLNISSVYETGGDGGAAGRYGASNQRVGF